jgi:hypothetical protein
MQLVLDDLKESRGVRLARLVIGGEGENFPHAEIPTRSSSSSK